MLDIFAPLSEAINNIGAPRFGHTFCAIEQFKRIKFRYPLSNPIVIGSFCNYASDPSNHMGKLVQQRTGPVLTYQWAICMQKERISGRESTAPHWVSSTNHQQFLRGFPKCFI